MNNLDKGSNVSNNGITLPQHDFGGLANVVKNAKPSIPSDENGFIPATKFDPNKPYADWQAFLDLQKGVLDTSPASLTGRISNLETEKATLETQHRTDETDFRNALRSYHAQRETDLIAYHDAVIKIKDDQIIYHKKRADDYEAKRDAYVARIEADIRDHFNELESALTKYHNDILNLTQTVYATLETKQEEERTRLDEAKKTLNEEKKTWLKEGMTFLSSLMDKNKFHKMLHIFNKN